MATRSILALLGLTTLACGGVTASPPVPAPPEEPRQEVPEREDPPPEERDGPPADERVEGPERGIPTPRPAPGQAVEAVFVRPFEGDYGTSGFLDHERGGPLQTTPWGTRVWGRPGHNGHDYVMPVGTPLFAVADAVVESAGELGPTCGGERAIVVQLEHDDLIDDGDYMSVYWHLSRVAVEEGARVEAGELIGWSGNTGCSSGPHLHFGVLRLSPDRKKQQLVDPYGWAGEGTDPFAGGRSVWMWRDGQAPALFRAASSADRSLAGPQLLRMVGTIWRDDPEGEYVEIGMARGEGPESVHIGGWSLGDAEGEVRWTFPKGTTLRKGSAMRISSGEGARGVLGMERSRAAWDGDGECIELRDDTGRVVDRIDYGGKSCP